MPDEEHDDTPDVDDQIDFTQTPQDPPVAPVPIPAEPPSEVVVREPAVPMPVPLEMAAERPTPTRTQSPGAFRGVPVPKEGAVPDRGAVFTSSSSAGVSVKQVMAEAERSVGRVTPGTYLTEADHEFVRDTRTGAAKGNMEALQSAMAEEAAAEAFAPGSATQVEVMRGVSQRPPAALLAIPMLAEAFRLIRRSALFRSAVPIRAGRIGTAGPADPARAASTFRTGEGPATTRVSHAPRKPTAGARPVAPRQGGVGMAFNAAERMRQLVGVSRRMVSGD